MKRSEMLEHMIADISEALEHLDNRPKTRRYVARTLAENILAMQEGFDIFTECENCKRLTLQMKWDAERLDAYANE